ncbi:protein prenyltransferase alpha subunit repeat-containing protein 1 isoform X2 [Archocentrus centrarchus]|uniref:protein prenyltransferase alpha subunit repeat-containing protein 1 isoform X2 n=1 Tax=Archocentrus centrarchus TaxID=63155 RepID=UPI0011EA31DD|nr:protein prenyltransferase alpha subunit repeat-containing protein 1 isoform X2 [Archocentrus centrarchus]
MAESEEEVDVLVQRVVKDITNAFKKNPSIDEIGVIPCPEPRYNRSPIVLVENKLGVESWCVKFLLPYVHNKLLLYRQRKHWLDREALVDITCTLLLLNPDFTTAWNVRRWVLQQVVNQFPTLDHNKNQHQQAEAVQGDLERNQQLSDHLARTLHQEMKVCSDAAGRYPSNYNAWSHRIWVLQLMAKGNIKVFHDELSSMRLWVSMHVSDHSGFHYRQFLLKELISEICQAPAHTTTSGSSQHGTNTVPKSSPCHHSHTENDGEPLGQETDGEEEGQLNFSTVLQLFHQEMELCSDLIESFPGHETLWSHRRHVFYLWHQWRREHQHQHHCSRRSDCKLIHLTDIHPDVPEMSSQSCASQSNDVNGQKHTSEPMEVDGVFLPDPHDSKRLKRGILLPCPPTLSTELSFVSSVLDSCCNTEQRCFAVAYKKWLDTVIGLQS